MKLFYFVLLLGVCSCSEQLFTSKDFSIPMNSDKYHFKTDSVLQEIQQENDIAIIVRSFSRSWPTDAHRYLILANKNNTWYAIKYHDVLFPDEIKGKHIERRLISQIQGDSIFQQFKLNQFWSIYPKMDECIEDINGTSTDDFHCSIRDASTQQIITFYNHKIINVKEYHAPDYFQECCPFNHDRELFIKNYNAVSSLKNYFVN